LQVFVWVSGAAAAFADTAQPLSPTNIFAPASTPAKSIFELSLFVLAVTGAIFLVVFTLLLYSVVKFRKRKNDDGREPPQVYGSNQVELAWTIIPILIVVALFMATARVIAVVVQALLAAIRMEEEMGAPSMRAKAISSPWGSAMATTIDFSICGAFSTIRSMIFLASA
jgi:heme/copper-type cytochrome/quinol oxidase subunit 2